MKNLFKRTLLILTLCSFTLYGFDYKVAKDDSGIWAYQDDFAPALVVATIGVAVYEGNSTRFGKTMMQSVDSLIISAVVTKVMKDSFTRARPSQTDSPNEWFQGSGHASFPSGHVSAVAAIVTPLILEYQEEQPWVWSLAALPVYQAVGRVKGQHHWQSDVTVGALVGALSGWFAHSIESPLFGYVMPDAFFVGIRTQF